MMRSILKQSLVHATLVQAAIYLDKPGKTSDPCVELSMFRTAWPKPAFLFGNAFTQLYYVLLKQAVMDIFNGFVLGGIHIDGKTIEATLCLAVVMVMLRLELFRRAVNGRPGELQPSADKYKKLLRECAPEAIGSLTCLVLVIILRSRGDTIGDSLDGHSREAWEAIKMQWPLLMTADTLLAIQVMLRLVVVLSALLRSGGAGQSPLLDECAALWCAGALAKCLSLNRSQAYWLEGPVGGMLPTMLEALLVPLLFLLGQRALFRSAGTMVLVVVLIGMFAQRNTLQFAEESEANILFTAVHCFEFLSAIIYAGRTMLLDNDGQFHLAFTHFVMVVQQSLAAYFWLQAFEGETDVNGLGLGIKAIQFSCLGQLCAYLAAATLHAASWFTDDTPVHVNI
ncbi:unnamed protein product [Effrenium voratum]|nr:unnamed protein product [Effrenium voratum]